MTGNEYELVSALCRHHSGSTIRSSAKMLSIASGRRCRATQPAQPSPYASRLVVRPASSASSEKTTSVTVFASSSASQSDATAAPMILTAAPAISRSSTSRSSAADRSWFTWAGIRARSRLSCSPT